MPVPQIPFPHGGISLLCALSVIAVTAVGCASPAADNPASSSPPDSASTSALGAQASTALRQTIAGIDAAVYAYGVVGAHLTGAAQRQALRAITTLDKQRAGFELALGTPVDEAAVAYALPEPITDATDARALAELLEMKLIPLFDQVASTNTGATRALAVNASRKAGQRAQNWQLTPEQ